MRKKSAPDQIPMTFDLHELPTAQHRAGLGGLILQIDSMGEEGNRRDPKLIPKIEELTTTKARIVFTRDSMQGVFDDLYAAKPVEVVVANKWPGKIPPKPGEFFVPKKDAKTGEVRPSPGFAYDVVQPQAPCLSRHLQGGKESPWLELWRQMVWSIPRGGNNVRSRAPFIDRSNQRPCGEGVTAWAQIIDLADEARSKVPTKPISGALMLGAQAINAEAVPFEGRVDHNLLLHFWQVVVLTFTPHVVSKKDAKVERVGYVLAIPDIADLEGFRDRFPEILQALPPSKRGRTPREVRIDLPDQGSLEVLWRLKEAEDKTEGAEAEPARGPRRRLHRRDGVDRSGAIRDLAASSAAQGWGGCVRAVESYHMVKVGNNVKLLSFSRLADRPGLIEDYREIAENYRSPLFRAARMRALLRDGFDHSGMIDLFTKYPWPFFIEADQTPKYLPHFGRDARGWFQSFRGSLPDMEIEEMGEELQVKHLGLVIQRIINRYVEWRAEKKTGIKVSGLKKEPAKDNQGQPLKRRNGQTLMLPVYPEEFREAQRRVCADAFLSMRSRHDQDFVEYFAGSICQADHQLSAANYQFLVRVLMTNPDPNPVGKKRLCWEDVKAIAMIAVSACSFNVRPRDAEAQGSPS